MILQGHYNPALKCFLLAQFVFFTGGIVFLTLIVNGSTTQFILHFLDMDKLSAAKVSVPELLSSTYLLVMRDETF